MQEWGGWVIFPFGIAVFFTILIWAGVLGWIINLIRPDDETEGERQEREHWDRLGIDPDSPPQEGESYRDWLLRQ